MTFFGDETIFIDQLILATLGLAVVATLIVRRQSFVELWQLLWKSR